MYANLTPAFVGHRDSEAVSKTPSAQEKERREKEGREKEEFEAQMHGKN